MTVNKLTGSTASFTLSEGDIELSLRVTERLAYQSVTARIAIFQDDREIKDFSGYQLGVISRLMGQAAEIVSKYNSTKLLD